MNDIPCKKSIGCSKMYLIRNLLTPEMKKNEKKCIFVVVVEKHVLQKDSQRFLPSSIVIWNDVIGNINISFPLSSDHIL